MIFVSSDKEYVITVPQIEVHFIHLHVQSSLNRNTTTIPELVPVIVYDLRHWYVDCQPYKLDRVGQWMNSQS